MKQRLFFRFLLFFLVLFSPERSPAQEPLPTVTQLAWHKQEFYLFVHFGPNTFTDKEWGEGTEPEDLFNPTDFDPAQWCGIAEQAGAVGIIITAKHHDGFCLWPSKFSKHTVRESKWKKGKGDVIDEVSEACRKYGLRFGVYISPWDRNHPDYGTPRYNDVFVGMMRELLSNYGPIWELWWDGANGEGPNGKKQEYDWRRYEKLVRDLSPRTVIFSDIGPDIRWVGNENGYAGKTNWNYLDTAGFKRGLGAPPTDTLNQGNAHGENWIPAECDVSIRPGWFYHAEEDDNVKTPADIFQLYLKSVGRGANLLLNVPPDRRGRIHQNDSTSLVGFRRLIDKNFNKATLITDSVTVFFEKQELVVGDEKDHKFMTVGDYARNPLFIQLAQPRYINTIILRENLTKGQQVSSFVIQVRDEENQLHYIHGTTIGAQRILTFPRIKTDLIVVRILESRKDPCITVGGLYLIDDELVER